MPCMSPLLSSPPQCLARYGAALLALLSTDGIANPATPSPSCTQTVYLTFDTGSQSQAQFIADTLKKHRIKATFFLANEKTVRGDYSLESGWAGYWRSLAADGHAFGTHTFDHVYLQSGNINTHANTHANSFQVKPQFGTRAGTVQQWDAAAYCGELKRSAAQFTALTGQAMHALWRAPGGRVSAGTLAAASNCGYQHVGWQTATGGDAQNVGGAGFSGDELPSERVSNAVLLAKALRNLKDGDVYMAHLGIWSRQDPWAPAVLEPLIAGLTAKGSCFATLPEHPLYGKKNAATGQLQAIQTVIKY
jgi:peptidoglycan/xylan/chitin deacetylase (PgdA/CDA1 family)